MDQFDSKPMEDEYSDEESDDGGEMYKLDGKKRKITADRSEETGDISEYKLSAHKVPRWS